MSHPDSLARKTLRLVIVLLAALVIGVSCASGLVGPQPGGLQANWQEDLRTQTTAIVLAD